jgi:hypothetical protein
MRLHAARILLSVTAVVVGLATAVHPASAAGTSYTWVGSSQNAHADNHSWGDPLNWSPNGVPSDGDSVSVQAPLPICAAHVDGIPAVTLLAFTLVEQSTACTVSVAGGAITVTGAFTWQSGTLNTPLTVAAGATALLTGGQGRMKTASAAIEVAGTATLTGASGADAVKLVNPYVLHISPGGTLNSVGDNDITFAACCVNPAHVTNDGTVSASGGDLRITAVQFDQRARLAVGTGARVLSTGAPVTAATGATYTGGGRWILGHGATGRFLGTQTVTAPFRLALGGESSNPGGTLGGTFTLAGTGGLDWTAGSLTAGLTVGHGASVHAYGANATSAPRVLGGTDYTAAPAAAVSLVNHGTVLVDQGAAITTTGRAHLINAVDGLLQLAAGTNIHGQTCCVSPDRITNSGGIVSIGSGTGTGSTVTISTASYQSVGGRTVIGTGKVLSLSIGAPAQMSSTTISGGGRLQVAVPVAVSGTVTVGTSTTLAVVDRGSVDGTALVTGNGTVSWTGGALSGALTVSTARVTVSGPSWKTIANVNGGSTPSSIRITAPTTISSGSAAHPNPVDLHYSKLMLAGSTAVGGHVNISGGTLQNTGTMTVTAGTAHLDRIGTSITLNSGTVLVRSGTLAFSNDYRQTAGRTDVGVSTSLTTTSSTGRVVLSAGSLTGTGTVAAPVANGAGVVSPGTSNGVGVGTLKLTRSYTQSSGARVLLDVAASSADRLTVGTTATVTGIASYRTAGTTVPPVNHQATVLTTGTGLTWHPRCDFTTGPGSTTGHWTGVPTSRTLTVVRRAGADTHC